MEKTITLEHITKIEGHAKLVLKIDENVVKTCELSAAEGSRYFEGIVKGRKFFEAHEITSRICGICSCAHVICAIQAIEDALKYSPTEQTKTLRLLMTLGERIRSHATHLYFLALPDYLGYESALAMAQKYKPELQRALNLMKVGNKMIRIIGGRDLHPVSATVGGWLHLPAQSDIEEIRKDLQFVKKDALFTCDLFSKIKYQDFKTEGKWFSLVDAREYPALDGVFSFGKEKFPKKDYLKFIEEHHEPYSSANFVVKEGHRYFVGALARINNCKTKLTWDARRMLIKSKIKIPSANPYHNTICQAIELVHCIDHAIKICKKMKIRPEEPAKIEPHAGTGIGMIEVPRGTLWHEYTLDSEGTITKANIITPTAQNLLNMQEDIRQLVPTLLNRPKEEMILEIEKLIRSYDPCFSCSAHFLEVEWG